MTSTRVISNKTQIFISLLSYHIKYIIRFIKRTRRAKAAIPENSVALERLLFPRSFR